MTFHFTKLDTANDRGEVAYLVVRDGETLGYVERVARASYRMHHGGRIRGTLIGYSRHWRAMLTAEHAPEPFKRRVVETSDGSLYLGAHNVLGVGTRRAACELLARWHDHPELRTEVER